MLQPIEPPFHLASNRANCLPSKCTTPLVCRYRQGLVGWMPGVLLGLTDAVEDVKDYLVLAG